MLDRQIERLIEIGALFGTRRRLLVLSLVHVALIAMGSMIFLRGLKADFSPQAMFTSFPDSQAELESFKETFGNTESVIMVLVESEDVLSQPALQYLHAVSLFAQEQNWAERVESVTVSSFAQLIGEGELRVGPVVSGDSVEPQEVEALRAAIAGSGLMEGTLVSADHSLSVSAIFLERRIVAVADLKPVMESLDGWLAANPPPSGVRVDVGGIPPIRVYVVERMLRDQFLLIPLSIVVSTLVLLLCFRWLPGVLLPNISVLYAAIITVGGMALFGQPFNIINQILPVLLMIIGIADSVHIINRYGEELNARDHNPLEAAAWTVRSMTIACFLTSFTTAIGFGSLVVSRTDILKSFGLVTAAGVMVAYVVTITFVPAALSLFRPPANLSFTKHDGRIEAVSQSITKKVLRYPRAVLAAMLAVTAASIGVATRVPVDTTLMEIFDTEDGFYRSTTLMESELDGILPVELHFTSDTDGRFHDPEILNEIDSLREWADQRPEVLNTATWSSYLHEVWVAYSGDSEKRSAPFRSVQQVASLSSLLEGGRPDPTTPYVTMDRRQLRVTLKLADVGSRVALVLGEEIQEEIDRRFARWPDVHVAVTGDAYVGSLGLTALINDLFSSTLMAFGLIFGFMSLQLRSVRLGLLSIPPNVLPLAMTMAYMVARGINLNTTTVIIFSIAIGLAVDNTIHILTRTREELQNGADLETALLRCSRGTGRAVLVTSAMLLLGLGVMFLSTFVPIRLFAELMMCTIVTALLGDLVMLPAIIRIGWPKSMIPAENRSRPTA